jgi:membrane protease YdiL (CAAX protease family)
VGDLEMGRPADYSAVESPSPERIGAVAAVWHTVLILAIVGGWAYRGVLRAEQLRAVGTVNRIGFYTQTIAAEWILLGVVLLGVWLYKAPIGAVLGKPWKSAGQAAKDFGWGLVFWLGSSVALVIAGLLLRSQNSARVDFLLPHNAVERCVWVVVAISAGICEEAIFRGYLQRQFLAATQNAPVAIALSAILFGAVHAYQGWKMMIMIGLLGAMLGILANWRGTVRTGMFAHAWQDTVAGLVGGLTKH